MKKESIILREARIKAGLTIQELADGAGLTWSTVQAIETGRIRGAFGAKMKLAYFLELDFKELWPETYSKFSPLMKSTFHWPERLRKANK